MQLGYSGIVVYIFLIFLKINFLELGHFGNTLPIYIIPKNALTSIEVVPSPSHSPEWVATRAGSYSSRQPLKRAASTV